MKKYSYVIGNPPYITITHKIQKEKINMNNKKIMKVTSTIAYSAKTEHSLRMSGALFR